MSPPGPLALPVSHPDARILAVDDKAANLSVLTQMLKRSGYLNVEATTDSATAITILPTFDPDLLIVDLHMPEPNGFAVIAALQALLVPDGFVPVLMLTADVSDQTREEALARGAHDLLTKPFRYDEMLHRVGTLLDLRARRPSHGSPDHV